MKHLLKLEDLTKEEIIELLDLADKLKEERKKGVVQHVLKGKTLGMIFAKSSTRTRVSFEAGIYQLGGLGIYLHSNESQVGRGEAIKDTARTLSRYVDAIMIRTYSQDDVEELAKYSTVPVINGLTDYSHPCQVLADFQAIRGFKGKLEGLKMCYVGDGNNMANTLIVGAMKVGMKISVACPKNYMPDERIVKMAIEAGTLEIGDDIPAAMKDADVIYTDVWASMGQEGEAEIRKKAFKGYQVNEENMKHAKPDAMVLHCLPAHTGEEISEETFEKHANEIFEEAENRLHAQKAVLVKLMLKD